MNTDDMLSLKSLEWSDLEHAYGQATDIPEYLLQLKTFPACENYRSEPYFTLWSSLCHQGTIFTASFAALPHIVASCKGSPATAHWSAAQLAICIEIARLRVIMPDVFVKYEEDYRQAIRELPQVTLEMQKQNPCVENAITHRAAIAIVNRKDLEAETLLDPEL